MRPIACEDRTIRDIARLQSFLRAVAAPGRTVVEVPPFTAFLDPDEPVRFLNYAIPADGAAPDRHGVERLRRTFREHDRQPRLEWIEEAAPLVAPVLAAAGMREELRAPLMACGPSELLTVGPSVEELAITAVGAREARVFTNLQRVAFGDAPLPAAEEHRDPGAHGGGAVLARSAAEPVAAAAWTAVRDGIAEIVGVATAAPWRGRGL